MHSLFFPAAVVIRLILFILFDAFSEFDVMNLFKLEIKIIFFYLVYLSELNVINLFKLKLILFIVLFDAFI